MSHLPLVRSPLSPGVHVVYNRSTVLDWDQSTEGRA